MQGEETIEIFYTEEVIDVTVSDGDVVQVNVIEPETIAVKVTGEERIEINVAESGPQGPKGEQGIQGPVGPQGAKGDKGDGGAVTNIVLNEVPSGLIDNVNTVFTSAFDFVTNSTEVFVNGIKQTLNIAYNEATSNQIIFTEALWPGAQLSINYLKN